MPRRAHANTLSEELVRRRSLIFILIRQTVSQRLTAMCCGKAAKSLLLIAHCFFIQLPEAIQDQIRITRRFDGYWMCLCRLLKVKSAAGNFDDLPKRFLGDEPPALSAD